MFKKDIASDYCRVYEYPLLIYFDSITYNSYYDLCMLWLYDFSKSLCSASE